MYSAKVIANYFLDKAKADGTILTQMQIQKLVYIAHGWHLALTNRSLLDEQVEAWRWGPVLPSLYDEFREFGAMPITRNAKVDKDESYRMDTSTGALLDRIWDVYGAMSGSQLSELTHKNDTPWSNVVRANGGRLPFREPIDLEDIKAHYQSLRKSG